MAGQKQTTIKAFDEVIELLAGGVSLRKACERTKGISKQTFVSMVSKDKTLQARYIAAKTTGLHLILGESEDDLDELAAKLQEVQKIETDTGPVLMSAVDPRVCQSLVNVMRTRIDYRKWVAAKMIPKTYGLTADLPAGGTVSFTMNLGDEKKDDDG